jgi:hypothetical protein
MAAFIELIQKRHEREIIPADASKRGSDAPGRIDKTCRRLVPSRTILQE